MSDKALTKKEKDFCRNYCATNSSYEAAVLSGYSFPRRTGLKLISRQDIAEEIKRQKKLKITKNEVITGLKRIAFGSAADCVRLLCGDETAVNNPQLLDLFLISEIKMPAKGGMEIKFFDRIRALEKLLEVSAAEDSEKGSSFLDAILKGSEMLNRNGDDKDEL